MRMSRVRVGSRHVYFKNVLNLNTTRLITGSEIQSGHAPLIKWLTRYEPFNPFNKLVKWIRFDEVTRL